METTLYNKNGDAVAYISDDYKNTIYLWEGRPVAYLHDDRLIYGINGRHLGWMIDEIIFNDSGERIGFTYKTCPVPTAKESIKPKKYPRGEDQSRWNALTLPKLTFQLSDNDFYELLKKGKPYNPREDTAEKSAAEEDV